MVVVLNQCRQNPALAIFGLHSNIQASSSYDIANDCVDFLCSSIYMLGISHWLISLNGTCLTH